MPRIGVCFKAEDPFVFAKRVGHAHSSRDRAQAALRYNLAVDCMPTEDIPPLSSEQINRMLGFALNTKKLKVLLEGVLNGPCILHQTLSIIHGSLNRF